MERVIPPAIPVAAPESDGAAPASDGAAPASDGNATELRIAAPQSHSAAPELDSAPIESFTSTSELGNSTTESGISAPESESAAPESFIPPLELVVSCGEIADSVAKIEGSGRVEDSDGETLASTPASGALVFEVKVNLPGREGASISASGALVAVEEAGVHPATFTRPLHELRARLGVPVSHELLALSMTHPSAVGEGIERTLLSNQRLEFLGDSLVGAICAEYFFRREPESPEGALTNRKISAVRKDALASAAKRLELGAFLSFGRGEDIAGGRERHSNLSDAFEALIAAIFLSNDWEITRDWVLLALRDELDKDPATLVPAKNRLQEQTQATGLGIPRYQTTQSHPKAQWFAARVFLADELRGQGEGKSKKLAEENAAKMALESFMSAKE